MKPEHGPSAEIQDTLKRLFISRESPAWCRLRVNPSRGFPVRGSGQAPALPRPHRAPRRLPGQDEAPQRRAGPDEASREPSELLCGVWLPSGSGKHLRNAPANCLQMSGRPPAVAEAARPPSTRRGRDPQPWHGLGPARGLWIPAEAHSLCSCLSFPAGRTPARLGWAARGVRGAPGSGRAGRAPHPPRWQPARHEPVFTPPRHSPGAGCAGCVEPGVPSPGPAPPCQRTGRPESPAARQRRATPAGTPGSFTPRPAQSLRSAPREAATRARLGLAGEGNAQISCGVLRFEDSCPGSHAGVRLQKAGFCAVTPCQFCPPRAATAELHHLHGFVAVQDNTRIVCDLEKNWRSTSLPEQQPFLLVLCYRLSSHPLVLGNHIPTLLAASIPVP